MIFFLFRATRLRRPRWAFWRRRAADVYAWLPLDTIDGAKTRVAADMAVRGWRIDGFEVSRILDATFRSDNMSVRANIRLASHGRPVYRFYSASDRSTPAGAGPIRSRYMDAPGVTVNPAHVPETLRSLLRFAGEWAIGDDVERRDFIAAAPDEEKRAFVEAVTPLFAEIEAYARTHERAVPVPDEVIVLNLLAEAADIASHDVRER